MAFKGNNLNYIRAKQKVEREKGFYTHAVIFMAVNLIITSIKMSDSLDSWSHFYEAFFTLDVLSSWVVWGVFLLLHFISFKYGANWEERKIAQFMKEDLEHNNNKL